MAVKADITIDIDKQVGNLQNLTNIYNARVGDNKTPLTVLWRKNGIALNLKGLHAFIAGKVGDGSYNSETDKVDFPVGTPVVKYEDDGSGTLDNGQSGLTTLLIPKQMWAKTGLFAGYIGLKDENGSVFTSKDIFFKVLGNVLDAGVAINYFIDDFNNVIQNSKLKLQETIDDARNAYESETKNAHDAAVAAVAELNRTREDNNNLADLIQSIENNIKANNIVTRPEYDKLANEIVNRLSQINTKPDYYDNYNDMVAANPNGTQNLCVTADNEHKWLYVNGQWLDLGKFSYADIAPVEKNVFYSPDHNNILINPDLHADAYGWIKDSKWVLDKAHSINDSQAYACYVNGAGNNEIHSIFQDPVNVENQDKISCGVLIQTNSLEKGYMQLLFKDANKDLINTAVKVTNLPSDTDYKLVKFEDVDIPKNAVTCALTCGMQGNGLLIICRPQINFGSLLLPYSTKELRDQIKPDHDNILLNPDLHEGAYGWYKDPEWEVDLENSVGNSSAYGIYVKNYDGHTKEIYQATIDVRKRRNFSAGVMVNTLNAEKAELQVFLRDANGKIIDSTVKTAPIPQDTHGGFQLVKIENQSIPAEAATGFIAFCMEGNGVLVVRQPQFNFEKSLLPYSTKELTQKINIVEENLNNKIQNIESHNLPYFVFDIDVNKVQDEWITTPFTYNNGNQTLSGYAQIAIQGDSSRAYPKKNYKIKIFSDSECKKKIKTKLKSSWTKLSNFNLKANWIDATQSRNLVNAHLMSNAAAVTPIKNNDVAKNLIKTQNFGQMEGFPIEVWFGDNYNGLYSCNTKKTDKVFGMDKDIKGTGVISVLDNVPAPDSQLLKVPTAKLDNVAYSDELHDTPDPELVTNWSKWLDFLNNSTDNDFHSQLASYLDINAAINIYLFGVLSREYDYMTKSVLFLTWNNGKYFYPIAYDLDSNWGQNVAGEIEGNPQDANWGFSAETANHTDGRYISNIGWNKLFERLYKLFKPEIKAQYLKLRNAVWRNDQIINAFKDYLAKIPEEEFEKDQALWKDIPSKDTNNFEQLHGIIIERCNQMDKWIEQLGTTPETPSPQAQPTEPKQ